MLGTDDKQQQVVTQSQGQDGSGELSRPPVSSRALVSIFGPSLPDINMKITLQQGMVL